MIMDKNEEPHGASEHEGSKPQLRRAFVVPPQSYPLNYYPSGYGYKVLRAGLQGNVGDKHSMYPRKK